MYFLVALYPLSSPNHNTNVRPIQFTAVALYPLSSPNHNPPRARLGKEMLRYILFHHQTTTCFSCFSPSYCCVISSFITKPQLARKNTKTPLVALYPLSSPNHNTIMFTFTHVSLRYILFHHQTTTLLLQSLTVLSCVISSFITKPQLKW